MEEEKFSKKKMLTSAFETHISKIFFYI